MQPGDLIDHYRLVDDLGAGAFATVWLARDEFLDADVAIKILADNWARTDDVRGRFIDEAKILRRIDHERIVRVFAVTELPGGQPAFVMTYADRGTLADRLHERHTQARRFGLDEVASIGVELAACLSVVHDFGVIHRDLKPSNVLFRSPRRHDRVSESSVRRGDVDRDVMDVEVDDVMVLADFGLAKDTVAASGFTMAAGTPAYMPPEQARTSSELDHRADIYSATAIIFELLTGVAPFDASSLSGVGRSRSSETTRLGELRTDIPAAWQRVVDRGLAPDPTKRYESANEFADAIAEAASASGVFVPTPPQPAPSVDRNLTGVRRRVDDIVRRFEAARSAGVDRRLVDPCTVGVIGTNADFDSIAALARPLGLDTLRLTTDDVRVGETDVIALGDHTDVDTARVQLRDILSEAPAGPIATVSGSSELVEILQLVSRRSDTIRASAALAILDATVQRAGSAALSESWVRVGDLVETVRTDFPGFGDLAALRAEAAGRLVIPQRFRDELRRLLIEVDATNRLGIDASAGEDDQLAAAVAALGRWREFQDSGRVPFTSRGAVETVVRSLERLWATLSGYTT